MFKLEFDKEDVLKLINLAADKYKEYILNEKIMEETKHLTNLFFVPENMLSVLQEVSDIMHSDLENRRATHANPIRNQSEIHDKLFDLRHSVDMTKEDASMSLQQIPEEILIEGMSKRDAERLHRLIFQIKYQKIDIRKQIMDHVWQGLEHDNLDLNDLIKTINEIYFFNGQINQALRKIEQEIRGE